MKEYLSLLKKRSFKGPASIWKRLLAFIIDLFVIDFVCSYPFRKLLDGVIPQGDFSEVYSFLANVGELRGLILSVSIAWGAAAMLYFALLEYYNSGQTIGKMVLDIKVESERKNLYFWQCLVRSIFLIPIFPIMLLWILDPLWLVYTKGQKRLSDLIAMTKVTENYTY